MKVSFTNCLGALALACILPATLSAQSITTTFAGGNGGSSLWGNLFDITVKGKSLHITSFDVNASAAVNTAFSIDVYITSKTWVGKDAAAAKWVKVATGSGKSAGSGTKSPVNTTDFVLAPGSYGMAIYFTGSGMSYTNGATATTVFQNKDVSLSLGISKTAFFGGSTYNPRVWNGTIYYDTTNAPFYGTYGVSCKGSGGVPAMTPTKASNLKLGSPFIIDITNLPKAEKLVLMMTGFRNNAFGAAPILPLELTGLGTPGCNLYIEPFDFKALVNAAGTSKFVTGIPNNSAFLGIALFHQCIVFDKAANKFGMTFTNAGGGVLGK